MMDEVSGKTFWAVISAVAVCGVAIAGVLWGEVRTHQMSEYHYGMPFYVEQRVREGNKELIDTINELRNDMQSLREALVSTGAIPPK